MIADRAQRASRLGDYFELQLRFATHMAERTGIALTRAVRHFTNLHRRFGSGDPDEGEHAGWQVFVQRLEQLTAIEDQTAWAQEFFVTAPAETLPADQTFFGCFGCAPPNEANIVRIHFAKRDEDDLSPLHRSKIERRKADQSQLAAFIAERYPGAAGIMGVSWLYNIDAYRRLFPPDYAGSAAPAGPVRLSGMSSWGQFLRHDERIKPDLRDALLRSLPTMDLAAPSRSFPLPVMVARAPIASFVRFYQSGA